eukprot:CAMPEP_0198201932 /NCGR_PEP_ID=MMETSP1445-20131203/4964_1 /TAXON_ID=36898 /ORGANISM="Pyramimonas sp., Strain CCMP2087" /LENGTH=42 /DNA_ID= /DNA_START= /DNA_END= /DNA_ORIENTATION=
MSATCATSWDASPSCAASKDCVATSAAATWPSSSATWLCFAS